MKDRLFQLRKEVLNMSRAKFGEAIGMSDSEIKNVEYGHTQLKENKIALICKEYGVNEVWLRTGFGEMFTKKTLEEEIAEFAAKIINYGSESFQARFVHALSKLDEYEWDVLSKIADEMQKNSKKEE